MKYIIITSKHHDGFAMYDSDVSEFSIVNATPFNRDPMKERAKACKREGIGWMRFDQPGKHTVSVRLIEGDATSSELASIKFTPIDFGK